MDPEMVNPRIFVSDKTITRRNVPGSRLFKQILRSCARRDKYRGVYGHDPKWLRSRRLPHQHTTLQIEHEDDCFSENALDQKKEWFNTSPANECSDFRRGRD
jgi:hypothetical protein